MAWNRYRLFGPREFAISMISIGITSLAIGIVDHRRDLRLLEETYGKNYQSSARKLAIVIVSVGIAFLLLVLLHE